MRWRLLDRVDCFESWSSIEGRKSVSLEEYSLLEPLGMKGHFPESLVVESCVQLARWLASASSGFDKSCTLLEIESFSFDCAAGPGSVLRLGARVVEKTDDVLRVACHVAMGTQPAGHGVITVLLVSLAELTVGVDVRALWLELYGKA